MENQNLEMFLENQDFINDVIETLDPLILCENQYKRIYLKKNVRLKCVNCTYDEKNNFCPDYVPIEIYDPKRSEFLKKTQWIL